MRKTPSACVGGRGVEKQGCHSALHYPSGVLATCISSLSTSSTEKNLTPA